MNETSLHRLLDQVEIAYEMSIQFDEPAETAHNKMRSAAKATIMNGHIPRETFLYAEMFMQAANPHACLINARRLFPTL